MRSTLSNKINEVCDHTLRSSFIRLRLDTLQLAAGGFIIIDR